jgi:hypothetical protein
MKNAEGLNMDSYIISDKDATDKIIATAEVASGVGMVSPPAGISFRV